MSITREEQLQYCTVCANRKIALNGEMVCQLTDAKADFDPTCPSYQFDKDAYRGHSTGRDWGMKTGPTFGLIISIASFVIMVARYNCNSTKKENMRSEIDKMMRDGERQREQRQDQMEQYNEQILEQQRLRLGKKKVSKDSTIVIDRFIDYTLLKNEYIMTAAKDDHTKVMAWNKKKFTFHLHKFRKSDNTITEWQKIRKETSNSPSSTTINYNMLDDNTFSYKIYNQYALISGKAKCFYSGKNCYIYQYEISGVESETLVEAGFDKAIKDHINLRE